MKKIITFFFLFVLGFTFAQNAIYYDKAWKETTKEKSTYYRPLPFKKFGELVLVKDYYNSGQLQFQGYFYEGDDTKYVGDAYWYDENGFDLPSQQSLNLSTQKELVYYNNDETIWKKISYNEIGKKEQIKVFREGKEIADGKIDGYNFSGTFMPKKPNSYYTNPFYNNEGYQKPIPKSAQTNTEQPVKKYNRKLDNIYTETIFWENGKPAKQVSTVNHDQSEPKFWDMAGNEIKGKSKNDKIQIYYHTKNDFAVKPKSITNVIATDSGYFSTETTFNKKSEIVKVIQKINQQLLELKTITNGQEHVLKYRNGKPFDGNFNDTIGRYNSIYKMNNGKIIGEVIVNDYKTEKLLAKGEYTNGKPNNGTFVLINNYGTVEFSTYKNLKKNGLQQKFNNKWDENPAEEFEMKEDELHGFRKIYSKENKKTYVSEYKNGKPFEGEIISDVHLYTYKKGEVIRIDEFDNDFDYLKSTETYKNNQLKTKTYNQCFVLPEKKHNCAYTGTFKNEQPFEGYFIQTYLFNEIPLLDYYENGKLKYQYSKNLTTDLNVTDYYEFDTKTTFKNGKVIDGFEFIEFDRSFLIKIGYKNEKTDYLELIVVSPRYFNQITFEIKNKTMIIADSDLELELKVSENADDLLVEVFDASNTLILTNKSASVPEASANSVTFYKIKDNQLIKKSMSIKDLQTLLKKESPYNFKITQNLFLNFSVSKKESIHKIFETLVHDFRKIALAEAENALGNDLNLMTKNSILTSITYNENGAPDNGFKITEKNNAYLVEYYDNGEVIKNKTGATIENIEKTISDIINQLNSK